MSEPVRRHKEQLHDATHSGGAGTASRTPPQWQLPLTVMPHLSKLRGEASWGGRAAPVPAKRRPPGPGIASSPSSAAAATSEPLAHSSPAAQLRRHPQESKHEYFRQD